MGNYVKILSDMPDRRSANPRLRDQYRFRTLDNIGVAAAEDDSDFLRECFVDTGHLKVLSDCVDPRSIIVGRTGSGKTALLTMLSEDQERVIEVQPESLALSYISNSTILQFFERLGVKLDIFFKLLWRHVLTVELIKRHAEIGNEQDKNSFLNRLRRDPARENFKKALSYIDNWGSNFWEGTESRIKEVTTNLEKNLEQSAKVGFPNMNLSMTNADKLSQEEKAQIVNRAQGVVNDVQIRELSEIISLVDNILDDRQKRYYIIIDRLDENWIEDQLRYRLIRALIETVKDFRKIRHAKIIIALRLDLIERVFRLTKDPGFQEEKYESLYLKVSWNKPTLTAMLDNRINCLIKRHFTTQSVSHKDILPPKIDNDSPINYILNRSLMRPRDVIMFFNYCIDSSVDRATISVTNLRQAEREYSRKRLKSLGEEWASDYPNLVYFTRLVKDRLAKFSATDITQEDIENTCLYFLIAHQEHPMEDILSTSARQVVNVSKDFIDFRSTVLQVFYGTGLVGLKTESFERMQWSHIGLRNISKSEISDQCKVQIHPMFWRALGVKTR